MNDFNTEKFNDFEEKNHLFDLKIDGWQLWPYMRFTTYSVINDKSNSLIRKYRREKQSVQKLLTIAKNCTLKNPLISCNPKKYLIFTSSTRIPTEDGYKCFITDDIANELEGNVNAVELFSQEEFGHKTPCYTKDIMYLDYIEVSSLLADKLPMFPGKEATRKITETCDYILRAMKEDLEVDFDRNQLISRARTIYLWHVFKKKELKKLFEKAKPEVIVEDCSYSASHMLINELAHEMGIKVVELQHGFIAGTHIGYNYGNKHNLSVNPDYFILFSDFWKNNARYPLPESRLISLGYPHYFNMKQKYKPETTDNGQLSILVLSQHIYTQRMLNDIKDMCDELDGKNLKYRVLYKLHPMEPCDEVRKNEIFNRANVEIVDNNKTNLYECFAKSNIQIGASSTAVYEGLGYQLKTILLDYPLVKDAMKSLLDYNYATLAENGKEIADKVCKSDQFESDINLFNESGALGRITDFLKGL